MNLGDFSSYFELMAAINLSFGGSEIFDAGFHRGLKISSYYYRNKIENERSEVEKSIESIQSVITISGSEEDKKNDSTIFLKLARKYLESLIKIQGSGDQFIKQESNSRRFVLSFKSLFLLTGIYCIYILLINAFGQFYATIPYCSIQLIYYSTIVFILINILIFIQSMTPVIYMRPIRMRIILIFLLVLVSFSILCVDNSNCPTDGSMLWILNSVKNYDRNIVGISTLLVASPFVLQIVRSQLHIWYFRRRLFYIDKKLPELYKRLQRRNSKTKIDSLNNNSDSAFHDYWLDIKSNTNKLKNRIHFRYVGYKFKFYLWIWNNFYSDIKILRKFSQRKTIIRLFGLFLNQVPNKQKKEI